MTARVAAAGTGAEASGSGSQSVCAVTVPPGVTEDMVTVLAVSYQATALETPPAVSFLGSASWTPIVPLRTDGTMGWGVYARRGLEAGDVAAVVLAAARSVLVLDVYVADADDPADWTVGAVTSRGGSSAVNTAAGIALPEVGTLGSQLNLVVSHERTTATPTVVLSSAPAVPVAYREAINAAITSAWFGTVPNAGTPSGAVTITYDDASANGTALQLGIPAYVPASGLLRPNNELVAVAWLKGVPYLGNRVATSLPADNSSWSASGFVTVSGIGGSPDPDLPVRRPVVQLDCWGVAPNSSKPPWNLAAQLAEQVRDAVETHGSVGRRVDMPAAYRDARVETVVLRTEPRRVPGDVAAYARFTMDAELWWKELTT